MKSFPAKSYNICMRKTKTWQGSSKRHKNTAFFLFVFLGMLSAFGPFVTDMYLPSLPAMASYFTTGPSMVQLGLTFSMLGLAAGQIIFGPLSDKYGRRAPLLVSMALYLLATLACIWSPTIKIFVCLRFIQGIAAAGGIVISRSIATDKFKGKTLTKALAIIAAINGMAPIAAPVIGGSILQVSTWKGIFAVLFVLGIILTGACLYFNESLSKTKRSRVPLIKTLGLFKTVLRKRKYVFCVLQLAFAMAILFSYIAASPFIIQEHYGYSAFAFSLLFAINAVALGVGTTMPVRFKQPEHCISLSCLGMLLFSVLTALALWLQTPLAVFEILLIALLFTTGMSFTATTALAMEEAREQAGTASALIGAAGFLLGSFVSPIVGLGNILIATGLTLMACALGAGICWILALRSAQPAGLPQGSPAA